MRAAEEVRARIPSVAMSVHAAPPRLGLQVAAAQPHLPLGRLARRAEPASLPSIPAQNPLQQEHSGLRRLSPPARTRDAAQLDVQRIRRLGWSAATILGTAMAGHALLETARDALFLRALPATRLPWAYLMIAALTGLFIRKRRRGGGPSVGKRDSQRERLMSTLLLVAVGTALAGLTLAHRSGLAAFGFYVWTGIAATLTALRFWVLLGRSVNRRSAERLYGPIAVGGSLGAALGALFASGLLRHFEPEALIIFASAFFAAAAALAAWLPADAPASTAEDVVPAAQNGSTPALDATNQHTAHPVVSGEASGRWAGSRDPRLPSQASREASGCGVPGGTRTTAQGLDKRNTLPSRASAEARVGSWDLLRDPLVLTLATLGFCATLTLTAADYLVKAAVAAEISGDALGPFFAKLYAALNLACLGVQVIVAPWFLRVMGVTRSLAALPLLMLSATLGLVVLGGLVPVLMLKAADGALRGPVYRTASEVLYVHLPGETLERVKALIDSAGHRIAQAVASLMLLVAASLGLGLHQLALALLVLGVAWLGCVLWLIPRRADGHHSVNT